MVTAANSSNATRIYVLYRSFYVYPSPPVPIRLHHHVQNSGLDTYPPIRLRQGEARAETLIQPREKLGPRCLGLIPPRRTLGPSFLGPRSAREKTRAQVLGAKQIPWVPISRVPAKAHALMFQSPPLSVIAWVHHVTADLLLCAAIGSVSPR